MCRPSCCKPRSQGTGVTAVAVLIGAGIAVHKIGHTLAQIGHEVINILLLAALATGAAATLALTVWVSAALIRWRLHCKAQSSRTQPVTRTRRPRLHPVRGSQPCLACGGAGEVLRANDGAGFEPRPCPECQPARLAG